MAAKKTNKPAHSSSKPIKASAKKMPVKVKAQAAGDGGPPDPEDIFQRLKRLFVADGQSPSRVTRTARIFTTTDGGLGYTRSAFANRLEGPINSEFGCHHPPFIAGQLSDGASVGNCRDQIIADNGQ